MTVEFEKIRVPLCGHHAAVNRYQPVGDNPQWSLVALHGFTGSGADFSALREAMSGLAIEWLCPDFMGHGASDKPTNVDPYRLPAALALIDRARRMARMGSRVILLGYSMGGRLALHYLKWAQPLPAILIGASPGIEDASERAKRRERDADLIRAASGNIEAFCEAWEGQELIQPQTLLPEPLRSQISGRRRQNNLLGLVNSLAGCGSGALPSLWSDLAQLPELACLYGEKDHKFSEIAMRMQAGCTRVHAHAIEAAGHAPHLENPDRVAAFLINHLEIS
jgi:2-succinyl-6-hydroxy-2,4-cyclohexadiene-1-carboxylate synthase